MCKKLALIFISIFFFETNIFADNFNLNNNVSSNYNASFNKNAAVDSVDSNYYNPAGTVMLKEGLHIKIDMLQQNNGQKIDYNDRTSLYENDEILPSMFFSYNFTDIAFFGSVTAPGNFTNYTAHNLPFYDKMINTDLLNYTQTESGGTVTAATARAEMLNGKLNFDSKSIAPSIGASYKLNNELSAALGYSFLYYKIKYNGSAKYNYYDTATTPEDYLYTNTLSIENEHTFKTHQAFGGVFFTIFNNIDLAFSYKKTVKTFDSSSSSVNNFSKDIYNGDDFNIPDMALLGINITLLNKLTAGISANYYINDYKENTKNAFDLALGVKYLILPSSTIECGYKYSKYFTESANYSEQYTNNHVVGAGLSTQLAENIVFNFSYAYFIYKNTSVDNYNTNQNETFERDSYNISFGIEYGIDIADQFNRTNSK